MGAVRPAKRQRRDRALPVRVHPASILGRVALKGLVDGEGAPQRAGLGVHEGVVPEVGGRDGARVEGELVEEVLQVDLLSAGDEGFGQVRDGVEDEVELALDGRHRLRDRVGLRAGEGALAPDDARDELGAPRRVGVGDHAADVVADEVDRWGDGEVLVDERDEVVGHGGFGERGGRGGWVGGLAAAAVVGGDDAVAGVSEGSDDMAELVGSGIWGSVEECVGVKVRQVVRLREAVDEEDGAFGSCSRWRWAVDVMQAHFSGASEPGIAPLLTMRRCEGGGQWGGRVHPDFGEREIQVKIS